eukprot:XP_796225.3 PREDICTED: carbohydrate sulfotransferase 15 [Strongylocentrotus purpuratus]
MRPQPDDIMVFMMKRRTHTVTIISICSTLVYLAFFHGTVIHDLFNRTEVDDFDDFQPVNKVERRRTRNKSSLPAWSYERRRDSAETSLKQLAPELFNALPEPFSSKMKNPCWNIVKKKPRQCLPYFYLIGMPKCGTTDLWNKLIRHPYIVYTHKEPHWWSRTRIGHGHAVTKLKSDPVSYYTRYAKALDNFAKRERLNRTKLVVGDGSASTMWDNRSWRHYYPNATRGPPHVIGELIEAIQPEALAIAILRNPTDRLYSDFLYFTNTSMLKLTPEYFHERVKTSITKFHECTKDFDVRTCTYETQGIKAYVRLEVGLYSIYVGDWLSFFPRKKLKIVKMADWHRKCTKTLAELYHFLALEPLKIPSLIKICRDEAENARSPEKISIGPMLPETRQLLNDFYSPYNLELARMLGDDRFLWNDENAGSSEESVP